MSRSAGRPSIVERKDLRHTPGDSSGMAKPTKTAGPSDVEPTTAVQIIGRVLEAMLTKDRRAIRVALGLRGEATQAEVAVRLQNVMMEATTTRAADDDAVTAAQAEARAAQEAADEALAVRQKAEGEVVIVERQLEDAKLRLRQASTGEARSTADVIAAENDRRLVARLSASLPDLRHALNVAAKKHEQLDDKATKLAAQVLGAQVEADAERLMRMIWRVNRELEVAIQQHEQLVDHEAGVRGTPGRRMTLLSASRGKNALERAGDAFEQWATAAAFAAVNAAHSAREDRRLEPEAPLKREPVSRELPAEAFKDEDARIAASARVETRRRPRRNGQAARTADRAPHPAGVVTED